MRALDSEFGYVRLSAAFREQSRDGRRRSTNHLGRTGCIIGGTTPLAELVQRAQGSPMDFIAWLRSCKTTSTSLAPACEKQIIAAIRTPAAVILVTDIISSA